MLLSLVIVPHHHPLYEAQKMYIDQSSPFYLSVQNTEDVRRILAANIIVTLLYGALDPYGRTSSRFSSALRGHKLAELWIHA